MLSTNLMSSFLRNKDKTMDIFGMPPDPSPFS